MTERRLEREPLLMNAVVKHCRGETWMTLPIKCKEGELARAHQIMACEHDLRVHQKTSPCRKSFTIRP